MRPNFGAEWAGSGTRCLRFARWVTPPGRKTRFRLLARLFRVGSLAHWVPPKGFFDASYIAFLLSQASPGASALRSETHRQMQVLKGAGSAAMALVGDYVEFRPHRHF